MSGIKKALALTTMERYVTLVANLITLSIVSRLLTPEEIGVSVLGTAVAAMVMAFREFATPAFVIQRKELSPEDVRTTVTIQVLIACVIGFGLAFSGSLISYLYEEPRFTPYFVVVGLALVVEGFFTTTICLLRREMTFERIALIGICNAVTAAAVTLGLAWLGFSYMSFAWAWLLSSLVSATLAFLLWHDRSIYRPSFASLRDVLSFGWYNGIAVVLGRIHDQVPYLFIGRILPIDAAALYNRSIIICQLPDKVFFGGLHPVLMPAFSAQSRSGGDVQHLFLRSVENITAFLWPAVVALCLLAHPIVNIILGDQWLQIVPLVQLISLSMAFNFTNHLTYPLLASVGAIRDEVLRSIIVFPVSAAIIVGAAFGGLTTMAAAWLIALPFQAVVSIYFIKRHIDITFVDVIWALRRAAVLAALSGIGPLFVVLTMGDGFAISILEMVLAIILCAIGWVIGLWVTKHPIQEILFELLEKARRRSTPSAAG